jgi:epoxide hydrolase-like predicted phosphatase
MEHNNIKAVIWDMGGVILRTDDSTPREVLAAKLGTTRQKLELDVFASPAADKATRGEIPSKEHFDEIAIKYHLDEKGMDEFVDLFWGGDRVDQDLLAVIRKLRGKYKTAMLSNAWDSTREFLTTVFPCLDPFDEVIFSAEVKMAKPQPEIYHLMLSRLGVKPDESIFLDDFEENIIAANALGIHGIHFKNRDLALADLTRILEGPAVTPEK